MRLVKQVQFSDAEKSALAEAVLGLRAVVDDEDQIRRVKGLADGIIAGRHRCDDEYRGEPVGVARLTAARRVLIDASIELDEQSRLAYWADQFPADSPGLPTTMQPSFMAKTLAESRKQMSASVLTARSIVGRALLALDEDDNAARED